MSNGDLNSLALERTSTGGRPEEVRLDQKKTLKVEQSAQNGGAPMSATLSLPAVMKIGLRWSTSRCLGGADANANDDRVLLASAILQRLVEFEMQRD